MRAEIGRDYFSNSTIVAQSSGQGGAISVVRTSGPDSLKALQALTGRTNFEPRHCYRALLKESSSQPIDDAVVVFFPSEQSYTGEDIVEYFVHSNPFIIQKLISFLIQKEGCSQALPGEFSFRSVRSGKQSVFQATSVLDVLSANNETALSMSLEKLKGERGATIQKIDEELEKLLILTEVGIDFSDQDIEEVSLPALKERLLGVQKELRFLVAGYERGKRIQEGVSCAFIGAPNVGKSSLFNCLIAEERAIVTEIPGTTRDLIREKLTLYSSDKLFSVTLNLIDTAGIRQATDPVEKIGIQNTLKLSKEVDLVFLLIDPSQPIKPQFEDQSLFNQIDPSRVLLVLTKSDLVGPQEKIIAFEQITKSFLVYFKTEPTVLWVSSVNETGIDAFVDRICDQSRKWLTRNPGDLFLTRLEQVEAIKNALDIANEALSVGEHDIFASLLRQLNLAMAPITGKRSSDEILGGVFSGFCIGK